MAKRWNRTETWVGLLVLGIGAVLFGVAGLFVYMSATATPLFPDPQSVPTSAGSPSPPQWANAIDEARRVVRAGVAEQNLPGVSVAVGIGGEILWVEGFGWSNVDKQQRVTPDTRFRIGTTSIALTSAAAGLLIEQDRLKLDEPIQVYVPEFPTNEWPITVRQVMGHVAGLRNDGGDEGPLFGQRCERAVEGVQVIGRYSLLFEPGTQFRFSNFGWIVISAAIESAAEEPFLTFMQSQIFAPLGMDNTLPDASIQPVENQSTSYFPRFAADPRYGNDVMRDVDYTCYAGASGFLSTPADLVRFAMAINGGNLLRPATVELLQAPLQLPSGAHTGYGLGWDLETMTLAGRQVRTVGHDGELLGGIAGSLIAFPGEDLVVAVLSNTSYANTPALGLKIAEAFANR